MSLGLTTSWRLPVEVLREGPGSYVAGVWTPGTTTQFTISATIQPANLRDYDQIAAELGGQRVSRMIRVYTSDELRVADPISAPSPSTGYAGDIVLYASSLTGEGVFRYRVIGVSVWATRMSLDHNRYLAAMEPAP